MMGLVKRMLQAAQRLLPQGGGYSVRAVAGDRISPQPFAKNPFVKTPFVKTPFVKTPFAKTPFAKTPFVKTLATRWARRRGLGLIGWPGIVGIGLLSICPAFYFSAIVPLQEKLAAAGNGVAALEQQNMNSGREQGAGQRTPEEQLEDFYRMFPPNRKMPEYLAKIFSVAQAQNISLKQGEYRVTRNKEGNLASFQMTFPVKGEYPQIRKYLAALLADIPAMSLQQVQFKRQRVGDSLVEANIRLVLYFVEQKS